MKAKSDELFFTAQFEEELRAICKPNFFLRADLANSLGKFVGNTMGSIVRGKVIRDPVGPFSHPGMPEEVTLLCYLKEINEPSCGSSNDTFFTSWFSREVVAFLGIGLSAALDPQSRVKMLAYSSPGVVSRRQWVYQDEGINNYLVRGGYILNFSDDFKPHDYVRLSREKEGLVISLEITCLSSTLIMIGLRDSRVTSVEGGGRTETFNELRIMIQNPGEENILVKDTLMTMGEKLTFEDLFGFYEDYSHIMSEPLPSDRYSAKVKTTRVTIDDIGRVTEVRTDSEMMTTDGLEVDCPKREIMTYEGKNLYPSKIIIDFGPNDHISVDYNGLETDSSFLRYLSSKGDTSLFPHVTKKSLPNMGTNISQMTYYRPIVDLAFVFSHWVGESYHERGMSTPDCTRAPISMWKWSEEGICFSSPAFSVNKEGSLQKSLN